MSRNPAAGHCAILKTNRVEEIFSTWCRIAGPYTTIISAAVRSTPMASARPTAIRRRCHQGLLSFTSYIWLRVSISPAVADEEDHSAKSSANQALLLTAVCASTCRTRLEAADGRTSPTYFMRMACESEAELSLETMLTLSCLPPGSAKQLPPT